MSRCICGHPLSEHMLGGHYCSHPTTEDHHCDRFVPAEDQGRNQQIMYLIQYRKGDKEFTSFTVESEACAPNDSEHREHFHKLLDEWLDNIAMHPDIQITGADVDRMRDTMLEFSLCYDHNKRKE